MLRAFGASAVLVGIAAAAFAQTGTDEVPAIRITAPGPVDTSLPSTSAPGQENSRTTPSPFDYRIGLLAGVSTENFWAYYGIKPTAWNAYVLGPTKPALFALDPSTATLVPELSALATSRPTLSAEGWRVDIHLRDDLQWSDGTPITAHDFVFTFEGVRNLRLGGGWSDGFPPVVESVVAVSDHDLRIEFGERPASRYGLSQSDSSRSCRAMRGQKWSTTRQMPPTSTRQTRHEMFPVAHSRLSRSEFWVLRRWRTPGTPRAGSTLFDSISTNQKMMPSRR